MVAKDRMMIRLTAEDRKFWDAHAEHLGCTTTAAIRMALVEARRKVEDNDNKD